MNGFSRSNLLLTEVKDVKREHNSTLKPDSTSGSSHIVYLMMMACMKEKVDISYRFSVVGNECTGMCLVLISACCGKLPPIGICGM